jgi:hypothetical protein
MTQVLSLTIRARIGSDNGPVATVHGREAWALRMLIAAGEQGCTPINHPGPRWSGYVHDLRKLGFVIETVRERHGGEFPGQHARYVLRSPVVILEQGGGTGSRWPANPFANVRAAGELVGHDEGAGKRTSGLP